MVQIDVEVIAVRRAAGDGGRVGGVVGDSGLGLRKRGKVAVKPSKSAPCRPILDGRGGHEMTESSLRPSASLTVSVTVGPSAAVMGILKMYKHKFINAPPGEGRGDKSGQEEVRVNTS